MNKARSRPSSVKAPVRFGVRSLSFEKMQGSCEDVSRILKSLSHSQRLLIMGRLLDGPKTVTELVGCCKSSQSQISQFLIRMKFEGLLESAKKGKFQYYQIKDQRMVRLLKVLYQEFCS